VKQLTDRFIVFVFVRPPARTDRPQYRHDPIRERLAGLEAQRNGTVILFPRNRQAASKAPVGSLRQRLDNSDEQAATVTVAIPASRVHVKRLAA
jgi:hypothetical protein